MKHELAVPQTDCSKVANTLAGWIVVENWLFNFRGNPHAAT